jgi:ribosomal protein L29
MAQGKKELSEKEIGKKIVDLKIELLRNPMKRGNIKKEIARLLTMHRRQGREDRAEKVNNVQNKLVEGQK